MNLDFADVLLEVIERNASDLHLTAGAHPTVRVRGHLTPLEDHPVMTTEMTREIVYSILSNDQRQRLRDRLADQLRLRDCRLRALSRQRLLTSARRSGRRFA